MAPNSNETKNGDDDPTITNVLKRSKDPLDGIIFSLRRPMSDLGPGLVLFFTSIPFFVGTFLGYKNSQNFDKVIGKSFSQPESASLAVKELSPAEEALRRKLAAILAIRAFKIATLGTLGCFTLIGAGAFYASGSRSLNDLLTKVREWAFLKRQKLDGWLGVQKRIDDQPEIRGKEFDFEAFFSEAQRQSEEQGEKKKFEKS